MKLSRRTNAIILWVISIGLLVGMVITFTPTLGGLGAGSRDTSAPAIRVNGEVITELEVARARQSPLFTAVSEGEVAEDLELLLVDELVRQEVFDQAAASTRVSSGEVRDAVREFREARGVAGSRNDQAYLQLIGQSGFDDSSFRDYLREQLRRNKYEESLIEDVTVTDEEVETYYEAFRDQYRSEERVLARAIVVDDAELAEELRNRAESGEDFAELAREHSLERADRAGAVGAAEGETEPQPVGRAAFPTAVANEVFALQGPGLSPVVMASERAYLVQVEEFLPSEVRPLEEVREQVREDALQAKQAGVVEARVEELLASATIDIPEGSTLTYDNQVVARVGDEEVRAAELARATYNNPQIQQSLSPQTAPIIVEFFKPTILEGLIDRKLAYQGATTLEGDFVGSEGHVAQQALAFVSRNASVEEEDLVDYYEANLARFTVPAQAQVTRAEFADADSAEAFRSAVLAGTEAATAAEEVGGTLGELGTVREGDLEQALDAALFGTDAFEQLPDGDLEVSDVLVVEGEPESPEETAVDGADEGSEGEEAGSDEAAAGNEAAGEPAEESPQEASQERYVVLIASRTEERVRPLEEVRQQVEQAVLESRRAELRQAWLEGLRAEIEVENLLAAEAEEGEAADPTEGGDERVSEETESAEAGGQPGGAAADETESPQPETEGSGN